MLKGIIDIHFVDSKENPFGVGFWGFNEGSGSPCANEEEVKKCVESLIKQHSQKYSLSVIDKRIKIKQMTLC